MRGSTIYTLSITHESALGKELRDMIPLIFIKIALYMMNSFYVDIDMFWNSKIKIYSFFSKWKDHKIMPWIS